MHLGLFGGTFDPPHICHTLFCLYVLEMTDVERILWVPCADHPFGKPATAFEHRLAMSHLAARALGPRVVVSDLEASLPRPSYTIHTVEALLRRQPDAQISLLVGSDILDELERWERIEDLRRLTRLTVVPRGGFSVADDALPFALPQLSSTDVRAALAEGKSAEAVLSPAVLDYIRRHGLYGIGQKAIALENSKEQPA
ncbi:MAG: nicotinate (nicotinamide) nucleotide adenylyltransferase [Candidatus Sumerlaeia bacterium]|nr:nicotinate (nicotinamide) nucleotide adenylyltransferase [Candidatus Sumerlaeia bacterium]